MRVGLGLALVLSMMLSVNVCRAVDKEAFLAKTAEGAVKGCSRSTGGYCRTLREQGPAGLEALLALKDREDVDPVRWRRAVDLVAGARYSSRSELFWHTDLKEALAESRKSGKPVLSLRMLGKLTNEYSCANSRFFRTTLYSSPSIAELLKDKFVLHWKTIREVPVMTIDFGDGRVLKRTITGNSAHYLLDENGRPLDVLPGLHAPIAFKQWLGTMDDLYERYRAAPKPDAVLVEYHRRAARRIETALRLHRYPAGAAADNPAENYWTTSVSPLDNGPADNGVGGDGPNAGGANPITSPAAANPEDNRGRTPGPGDRSTKPDAADATDIAQPKMAIQAPLVDNVLRVKKLQKELVQRALRAKKGTAPLPKPKPVRKPTNRSNAGAATRIAAPKSFSELPLVRNVRPNVLRPNPPVAAVHRLRDSEIAAIARSHPELKRLDPVTEEIMVAERSDATSRERIADPGVERNRTLSRLAQGIAEDTVRNEFDFHLRVHRWFTSGQVTDVESLDRRVYDELFLMPLDDKWLGLVPRSTYTALENDGLVRDED